MDCLKDKTLKDYNYTSRYNPFYLYYNIFDDKYMYGITGQLSKNCSYIIHEVKDTDTFDSIALKYYGRPDLFWVIADFNRVQDSLIKPYKNYKTLNIPTISEIQFIK